MKIQLSWVSNLFCLISFTNDYHPTIRIYKLFKCVSRNMEHRRNNQSKLISVKCIDPMCSLRNKWEVIHNAWLGAFCLGSGVFSTNSLTYTTIGITVIHNNWLGYPFMVCNEANLDLFPQTEDCSQCMNTMSWLLCPCPLAHATSHLRISHKLDSTWYFSVQTL